MVDKEFSGLDTTLPGSGDGLGPEARRATLPALRLAHAHDPARVGETLVLGRDPVPLGRGSRALPGGPLDDPGLSREHAEVCPAPGGGRVLRDLGSRNGTFLNGVRVDGQGLPVEPGDVIRVGDTLLLVDTIEVPSPPDALVDGLLGLSDAARRLRSATVRAARARGNVLVRGETGTGKELVAASIARLGRPSGPSIVCNVNATPLTLQDAWLFGHEKGAFTDAREARRGLFREADGGTLFLDEIGDLPVEVQARLLRAVETGEVVPLGASRPVRVDVRVVAATHRDLLAEVAAGRFREDLLARLAQLEVVCPPLRERRIDVPILAAAFARGRPIACGAMERLIAHPWPFNVRELQAVVAQMASEDASGGPLRIGPDVLRRLDDHRAHFEAPAGRPALDRAALEDALRRTGGNVARAAALLGRDRTQLYRLVRAERLDLATYR